MEKVIDSKKKQLSFQEVMMYRVYDEAEQGTLPHAPEVALMLLIEELKMPNCEAVLFGNTFFIYHTNESRDGAIVRMLNVDTAKNLMNNCVKFARHIQDQGIKHFIAYYQFEGYKKIFDRLQQQNFGTVVTKQADDNVFVSCVTMANAAGEQ